MTKLFQSKDEKLRRLMYLVIKELKPDSDCVIIVTSTLTKDMNAANDLFRANAIRVLCTITDVRHTTQPQTLSEAPAYAVGWLGCRLRCLPTSNAT